MRSWRCLTQPLGWLQEIFLRARQALVAEDLELLELLAVEVRDSAPGEFQTHPGLIGLMVQAQTIMEALTAFQDPAEEGQALDVVDSFLGEISVALDHEQSQHRKASREQWSSWVKESLGVNTGWAHKWSQITELWRPPRTSGSFEGKRSQVLEREAARLSDIWGCTEEAPAQFTGLAEDVEALPQVTVDDFRRAVKTFSARTSQTWDGLQPRHFGLLEDDQVEVVIKLFGLIERIGNMPTSLQGIVATLIPKLNGDRRH